MVEPGELLRRLGEPGLAVVDCRFVLGEPDAAEPAYLEGHIPGAENAPFAELAPAGRFLAPGELRERLGDEPFVAYCGSGVTAAVAVLAAELAGVEVRLYPGGWSEWNRRGLPVER